MDYETILVSRAGPIATVTVNRPESLNALNTQVMRELRACLARLTEDRAARVIVLTGAGDKAFVAGADIKEMAGLDPQAAVARSWEGAQLYDAIRHQPQPVIASINGYALGGGMLLAIACDVRIAADTAEFGYPEIRLGIFPGTGGTVLLDRLIGAAAARAVCLTGERFSAERAYELGIVTKVVPALELRAATRAQADTLAGYSPVALRELKHALNASLEMDYHAARAEELKAYRRCFEGEDRAEGMRAFIEKRAPNFTGR